MKYWIRAEIEIEFSDGLPDDDYLHDMISDDLLASENYLADSERHYTGYVEVLGAIKSDMSL